MSASTHPRRGAARRGLSTRAALVLMLALLVVPLAGCLSGDEEAGLEPAGEPSEGPVGSLGIVAERTLVSPPGHRMSEFSVATDPTDASRLIVAGMDLDDEQGASNCVIYVSEDGGRSWEQTAAPFGADLRIKGDPWLAIGPSGEVHTTCIDVATQGDDIIQWLYHTRSEDHGRTWEAPVKVPMLEADDSMDKSAVGIDPDGRVYACAADLDQDRQLTVTRSLDGGQTWQAQAVGDLLANCNGVLTGPDGAVHVLWCRAGDTPCMATGTVTTRDGGETWEAPVEAGKVDLAWMPDGANRHLPDAPQPAVPSLAVDPTTGRVVVAWGSADEQDRFRVHLSKLDPGDERYHDLVSPVPEDHRCSACHVTRPTVAFDQEGRLGMLWKVTRGTTIDQREIWFSILPEPGDTWADPIQLAELGPAASKADPRHYAPHPDALTGGASVLAESLASGDVLSPDDAGSHALTLYGHAFFGSVHSDGGDYWTLAAGSEGFVPMWVDHAAEGKPQLWSAIVETGG